MREFSASYDTAAKVISAIVCLMLLGVALALRVWIADVPIALLMFLAFAYSPRGYAIDGGSLIIKRLVGNIRVPLESLREVRVGTLADFTGCIRLAGSGGLFGYYGLFRTSRLGKSSWYVTDRSRTVIARTDSKTFVLSPDDVGDFLRLAGETACPTCPAMGLGGTGIQPVSAIVGVGVAVLAIGFVVFALLYSPGVPGYTLAGGSLTIHDRFYPVTLKLDAIDAAHARVVDLTVDTEWRPTLRTNGFANRHYQSGWYRVANGKTVRLYRAGGNRLVLIPPKSDGTYVLYQAQDPAGFIAELQR